MTDSPRPSDPLASLPQSWPRPSRPRPVVLVGAGGIARAAHLPAYRAAGIPVAGVFDVRAPAAAAAAQEFALARTFASLGEAAATPDAVFDLAVPADQILGILAVLPAGAPVLIQKPMGRDLDEARRIVALCAERRLIAAVNHQLRFAPAVLALREALARGHFGRVTDVEMRVVTHTPWHLWDFLRGIPRMEVLYHALHYLDLCRSLLGEPERVLCLASRHPEQPELADARSAILLEWAGGPRGIVTTHHTHAFGLRHAASHLRVEGTGGAAVARLGVNLDYPTGVPDTLEVVTSGGAWQPVPLRGSWFVAAFEGPMCNLQRYAAGEDQDLWTAAADALETMALVEACYRSDERDGQRRINRPT